jgi:hypothetical protein
MRRFVCGISDSAHLDPVVELARQLVRQVEEGRDCAEKYEPAKYVYLLRAHLEEGGGKELRTGILS